jgi:hypothetical protein
LPAARYGIISGTKNMVTTVILVAALLSSSERFDRRREDIFDVALGLDHAQGSTLPAAAKSSADPGDAPRATA